MKKRFLWIVELFIWLLILFSISGAIMFSKYSYKKQFNTYQIFLPDIDGLTNGSPVKFMGIQIGYISQVDIVGDDVYVKFVVTEKGVRIPTGSVVTVEFSGLGGSKSLEVYPPNSKMIVSDKLLIAQSPKRIHDSLGMLNDMVGKIMDITYDFSYFMDQMGIIKKSVKNDENSKSIGEFLDFSDKWINKAQTQSDKLSTKLNNKNGVKNEQRQNKNN